MTDYLAIAREAAIESHGKLAVGELSHTVQEDQDGVLTYLFGSKLKGYPDWLIAVTLFIDGWNATVSEVVLTPGETSLVAPKWVPWSERLADYKALQAAIEAEAAAAAALADEDEDEDSDASDEDEVEIQDVDDSVEAESEEAEPAKPARRSRRRAVASVAEESAVADVPEAPSAEDNSDTAGDKPKGLFKWKTLRGNKKRK